MISKSKLIDADDVRAMLLCMHRIRQFEEAAGQALKDGHVRGSVHQYSGEEAIATGICRHLDRKSTRLNSSHSQQSRMPSSA